MERYIVHACTCTCARTCTGYVVLRVRTIREGPKPSLYCKRAGVVQHGRYVYVYTCTSTCTILYVYNYSSTLQIACVMYMYCPAYIVHRVAHGTRKFFPQGRVVLPKVFAVVPAQEMGHERGAEGRGTDLDARPPLDGAGDEGIPA